MKILRIQTAQEVIETHTKNCEHKFIMLNDLIEHLKQRQDGWVKGSEVWKEYEEQIKELKI